MIIRWMHRLYRTDRTLCTDGISEFVLAPEDMERPIEPEPDDYTLFGKRTQVVALQNQLPLGMNVDRHAVLDPSLFLLTDDVLEVDPTRVAMHVGQVVEMGESHVVRGKISGIKKGIRVLDA